MSRIGYKIIAGLIVKSAGIEGGHRPGECIPNIPDVKPQYVSEEAVRVSRARAGGQAGRHKSPGPRSASPPKRPRSSSRPRSAPLPGVRGWVGKHPVAAGALGALGTLGVDGLLRAVFAGGAEKPAPVDPFPSASASPSTELADLYASAVDKGVPHALGGAGLGALASHVLGGPKWLGSLLGGAGGYFGRDHINDLLGGK